MKIDYNKISKNYRLGTFKYTFLNSIMMKHFNNLCTTKISKLFISLSLFTDLKIIKCFSSDNKKNPKSKPNRLHPLVQNMTIKNESLIVSDIQGDKLRFW